MNKERVLSSKHKKREKKDLQIMSLMSVVKIKFVCAFNQDERCNCCEKQQLKKKKNLRIDSEDDYKILAIQERLKKIRKNNVKETHHINKTEILPNLNSSKQFKENQTMMPVTNKINIINQKHINCQLPKSILPEINFEVKSKKIVITAQQNLPLTKVKQLHTYNSYEQIKLYHKYIQLELNTNKNKNRSYTVRFI